jgi:hypothetical protein
MNMRLLLHADGDPQTMCSAALEDTHEQDKDGNHLAQERLDELGRVNVLLPQPDLALGTVVGFTSQCFVTAETRMMSQGGSLTSRSQSRRGRN